MSNMNEANHREGGPNGANHLDEIACQLFIDGQLDQAQSQAFEAHVAGCSDCRALVRVLQQESLLLTTALLETEEPFPARLRVAPWEHSHIRTPHPASLRPARQFESGSHWTNWAPWAWALGFFIVAAACFTAWTDILQPWAYQYDQTGIQSSSLLLRALMTIVFWEGWPNMLDKLEYAVYALIGALTTVAVAILLREHWRRAATVAMMLAGVAALLGLATPAGAAEIRRGSDINVPAGETINNDLIAAGQSVRIDGTVNGDLITFSQDVTVNGRVTGDIIAFGDMIQIDGPVGGNIRCFCNTLTLNNTIEKNLTAFAAHVQVNPEAAIKGGVIAFAAGLIADGKVGRDLLLFVSNTTLNGTVGGDIRLRGGQFTVGPTAQIAGRLQVTSGRQPDISSSAKLGHALEYQALAEAQSNERAARRRRFAGILSGFYIIRQFVSYGVAFLCGLLLIKLFPALFESIAEATRGVGLSFGIGAILLIAGMPLLILSIMLILAGAGAGFATLMLYFPILYASQIFVGTWIGEKIMKSPTTSHLGQLAVGLLILRLLGMIPFLGFFVWIAVFMWGAGAISIAVWNRTRLQTLPPTAALA